MPKPWDATLITLTLRNVVELYGSLFEPLNDIGMKSLLGETSENTNMLPSEIWLYVYFLWCNRFRDDNDVFCECGEYKSCR